MYFPGWVDKGDVCDHFFQTLLLKVFALKFCGEILQQCNHKFSFHFFSDSKTIMNFTLSNIIGSTLDPRPQVILQKNLSVILRYDEVCSLASKLIHNCD